MIDREWKDCPSCGSKGTMVYKEDDSTDVPVQGLRGYFCSRCGEGFYDKASNDRFNDAVSRILHSS